MGPSAMKPAASHAAFAADPHGRCLTGPTFAYGWPTPGLCVTAIWGAPGPADLESLAKLYALELEPPAEPHAAIIDTLRVEAVHPEAFAVIERYVRGHHEGLAERVTRLAIVRRAGFVGAVAAGFFAAIEPPYPVAVFDDFASALRWTDGPEWVEGALERWARAGAELSDLRRGLRRAIEARLPATDMARVAADLGLAVRTLQRKLRAEETTYRAEQAAVQVAVAKRWLRATDAPITQIGYEVGCSTPQRFSALFKREVGESPSDWRAALRE
jgi:AraC-like DNA-binding protein